MKVLLRAMHAEQLKLRNTLAFWLCLLSPLIVTFIGLAMVWSMPAMFNTATPGARWPVLIDAILGFWASLMLPLFVTLETSLLTGLEHGNQQWKHLLVLPLPRYAHYLAKLAATVTLLVLATVVLCLLIVAGGLLLMLSPNSPLSGPPDWTHLLSRAVASMVAGLAVVSFQLFIAMRWRSFSVAMICGIAATLFAAFTPKGGMFGELFPWAMSATSIVGDATQRKLAIIAGLMVFLLMGAFGAWDFSRREVA